MGQIAELCSNTILATGINHVRSGHLRFPGNDCRVGGPSGHHIARFRGHRRLGIIERNTEAILILEKPTLGAVLLEAQNGVHWYIFPSVNNHMHTSVKGKKGFRQKQYPQKDLLSKLRRKVFR